MIGTTPDLLSHLRLSRSNASLSAALERAGTELTTFRKSDILEATGGDPRRLYGIETRIARLTARTDTLSLAASRASLSQSSLQTISAATVDIGVDLLAEIGRQDLTSARTEASQARNALGSVIGALNASFAGRSLFSGAAVDTAPLISSEEMIAELRTLVDAAPDVPSALAAIDTYFNDPAGGFATSAYRGATQDAPPVETDDGEFADYAPRADADPLRAIMQGLATAVMAVESDFSADPGSQTLLLQQAGDEIVNARLAVVELGNALGVQEARIEEAATSTAAEQAALELARSGIIAVDPYEAAARFAELQGQLDSLYTVTARLTSMSLTSYLR
ncbi:flagellin [Oceanicella sp. SM1341]|uniref:flagellin n=1 Tax=Oceanicella sp. SM1341 TaxID=1548889 RepID=UPI000E4AD619|nr:flagellin [Oceanicella sp. SM1341]